MRLHYVYPYPHVDKVMDLMASGKVLPYLDIPFQHSNPEVLRRMRRPASQEKTLARVQAWRAAVPDLTLRSTFIVGFPGETEKNSPICSPSLRKPSLIAWAASSSSRWPRPRQRHRPRRAGRGEGRAV